MKSQQNAEIDSTIESCSLHQNSTDAELIIAVQQGSELAFTIVVNRYKDAVTNFVYRYIGQYDEAVDISQETFVRLYRYAHNYDGSVKFNTWLYTIATNLAKTELSKYWRKNSVPLSSLSLADGLIEDECEIVDSQYMPDARVDSTIIAQQVQRALMNISPSYREIVILRDINQLSYDEIAVITQLEIGTVKSRINRGRSQLQKQLQSLYEELQL